MTGIYPAPISCGVHYLAGLQRQLIYVSGKDVVSESPEVKNNRLIKTVVSHHFTNLDCLYGDDVEQLKTKRRLSGHILYSTTGPRGGKCAFIVFSDNKNNGNGENFATFITEKGFGNVTSSGYDKNPNSGNQICVWTWEVDWKALQKYSDDQNWKLTVPVSNYEG